MAMLTDRLPIGNQRSAASRRRWVSAGGPGAASAPRASAKPLTHLSASGHGGGGKGSGSPMPGSGVAVGVGVRVAAGVGVKVGLEAVESSGVSGVLLSGIGGRALPTSTTPRRPGTQRIAITITMTVRTAASAARFI